MLRYDHFGRGLSDRPDTDYGRALDRRQLLGLLDALEQPVPVQLVGISFGAATAVSFAAEHPKRVASLALLAPVLDYAQGRSLFTLASLPGVGEWYARVLGVPGSIRRAAAFLEESGAPDWSERYLEQTRYAGFEAALLSFARTDALRETPAKRTHRSPTSPRCCSGAMQTATFPKRTSRRPWSCCRMQSTSNSAARGTA